MARTRTISPDIWADADFSDLGFTARLLYIATISLADDDGRLAWNARDLYLRAFARDPRISAVDVATLMTELEDAGFLRSYIHDGKTYAHHPNWAIYQKISHPTPSKLPNPPELSGKLQSPPEPSAQEERVKRTKRITSESDKSNSDAKKSAQADLLAGLESGEPESEATPEPLPPQNGLEAYPIPGDLPADWPDDGVRMQELANRFLSAFGNTRDQTKKRRARPPYEHVLSGMKTRRGSTVHDAWVAFAKCRFAQDGAPIFGSMAKLAMNHFEVSRPHNVLPFARGGSGTSPQSGEFKYGFKNGRPHKIPANGAEVGFCTAADAWMPKHMVDSWLRDHEDPGGWEQFDPACREAVVA